MYRNIGINIDFKEKINLTSSDLSVIEDVSINIDKDNSISDL